MSDTELLVEPKTETVRRLEVFTGAGRRRAWTAEQQAQIVAGSYAGDVTVSVVARRHGLTPQQLFGWRRAARLDEDGALACWRLWRAGGSQGDSRGWRLRSAVREPIQRRRRGSSALRHPKPVASASVGID